MDIEQQRLIEELLFTGKELPSFVKMLYFGHFSQKLVFPYPVISSIEKKSVEDFVKQVSLFAEKEIDAKKIDQEARIPDSVIKGLGELGVLGMSIPKEFGGLGISQYGYCRVMETLSRYCGSTALFVNAHQSVGMKALLLFGTKEQQDQWLPKLAKGHALAAFSLTEKNAGSDAAGIETQAVYNPDRDTYTITGRKQWTTNGAQADILTVMAKTDVETPRGIEKKVTAFLVTPDLKGFKVIDAALDKVGMRGSRTANLAFEGVEVPAINILGPKGGGLKVCLTVLDYGRTTFGACCTGTAKYLMGRALQYAKSRHQFNRPLASFGLVKQMIAHMGAYTYAMEAATYLTAGLLDKGKEDIMLEAAILKVFTSESLWKILYNTMQIFGGRSFFTDEPFERIMRDSRLNMIGEGSNEVLKVFVGVVGIRDVGMNLKELAESLKEFDYKKIGVGFKRLLNRLKLPVFDGVVHFEKEGRELSKAVRRFGIGIVRLLVTYKEEVIEHQLELERVYTAVCSLYTISAVLGKIQMRIKMQAAEKREIETAKLYCRLAFDDFDVAWKSLFSKKDGQIESLAEELTR